MPSKRRLYKAFKKLGYTRIHIKGYIFLKKYDAPGNTIISINLEDKKISKYYRDGYNPTGFYSRPIEYEETKLIFSLLKKEGWFNEK